MVRNEGELRNSLYRWIGIGGWPVVIILTGFAFATFRLKSGLAYNTCMVLVIIGAILVTYLALQHLADERVSSLVRWGAVIVLVLSMLEVLFGAPGGVRQIIPNPGNGLPPIPNSQPAAIPAATPVATAPTPPLSAPVDWRQEWVRLMDSHIQGLYQTVAGAGLAATYRLEDIPPVSTFTLAPGETRWCEQVFSQSDPGHVWITTTGDRHNVEVSGSVRQNVWWDIDANPCRLGVPAGNEAVMIRLKPDAKGSVRITTEAVLKDEQRHRTDVALQPAVKKVYRNVPGRSRVAVAARIITELGGRRVESTITVLLFASTSQALDPTSPATTFSVDVGNGWQSYPLKFEATTIGKDNPPLFVTPNAPGSYDIVVVLTPT